MEPSHGQIEKTLNVYAAYPGNRDWGGDRENHVRVEAAVAATKKRPGTVNSRL